MRRLILAFAFLLLLPLFICMLIYGYYVQKSMSDLNSPEQSQTSQEQGALGLKA
jgi:hypothetical protein